MRPNESFICQPIRSLQTMLRVIATDLGDEISVIPDGIYGGNTMASVAAFQRSHGLPSTGVTDQQTWEKIVEAFTGSRTRQLPAQQIEVVLDPGQSIKKNESHPNLLLAQSMLVILSKVYAGIMQPQISGILDLPTVQSLESFQEVSLLPVTGELDKITWKHLALHYPLASNLYISGRIQG